MNNQNTEQNKMSEEEYKRNMDQYLKLCNIIFDSTYKKLTKIISHPHNYEFIFEIDENEDIQTIKILAKDWFDEIIDICNEISNAKNQEEIDGYQEKLMKHLEW